MFKLLEYQNFLQHCHQRLSILHHYFGWSNKIIFRICISL